MRVRCEFTRGASRVVVGSGGESVELRPSVYALFGPNGSGKSSLLALLSSCARGGTLPAGLALAGECDVQLRLSADDIVEECSTSESAPGAARERPESVRRATLR